MRVIQVDDMPTDWLDNFYGVDQMPTCDQCHKWQDEVEEIRVIEFSDCFHIAMCEQCLSKLRNLLNRVEAVEETKTLAKSV